MLVYFPNKITSPADFMFKYARTSNITVMYCFECYTLYKGRRESCNRKVIIIYIHYYFWVLGVMF